MRFALVGLDERLVHELAFRIGNEALTLDCCSVDADPSSGKVDALVLVQATPSSGEVVERWLSAGKSVVWAAPAGLRRSDLNRLHSAALRRRSRFYLANPDRSLPSRRLIKQQLDAGQLGEVGLIRLRRWQPPAGQRTPAATAADLWRELDLVMWLLGRPPQLVYATAARRGDDRGAALLQVHLGFSGGSMALVDYSDRLPPGEDYGSLAVIGSTGAAYWDDHQNMQLLYQGGAAATVKTSEGVLGWAQLLSETARELASDHSAGAPTAEAVQQAAGSGAHPETVPSAARRVAAVIEAVDQSLESRQAVQGEF